MTIKSQENLETENPLNQEDFPEPEKKTKKLGPKATRTSVAKSKVTRAKNAERELKKELSAIQAKRARHEEILKKRNALEAGETTLADEKLAEELKNKDIIFEPNPGPQTDFLAASEDEVFFGGARGASKTYGLLIDPLRYCDKTRHRALLIRRTMPELREIIFHTQQLYPKAYPGARWREQEKEWIFPSGARVEFGYAEHTVDLTRYQGQAYTWIGVDEIPLFPTNEVYTLLKGSLRSVDPNIPTFFRCSGNPGSVGAAWIKEMFIDPAPPGKAFVVEVDTPKGKRYITRRFIPATVFDNPYLMKTDSYMTMLASLPEIKKKQWLYGDWDTFENMAFPEFDRNLHVVDPYPISRDYVRFRACDWGYNAPACVLWFAVDYDNNLVVYKELYAKGNTADEFAKMVRMKDGPDQIHYGIMDQSVWQRRGDVGIGIPETMAKHGVRWRPSDKSRNSRINGRAEIHRRLRPITGPTGEKTARLRIFSTCTNLIRTLPRLPVDENNPEDVDTKAEDHAYDALRYGCMSRPIGPGQIIDWINAEKRNKEYYAPADNTFGY